MFDLKTLDIWVKWAGQYCQASSAFACLCLVYCFWIAYADLDGFRIDAAKHMGPEALRTFCDVIREFTQSIGKERFLLAGEISGGREHAWEVVEKTGLDAALGIEDVPGKLEGMVTGYAEPADYFSVFRNWILDSPTDTAGTATRSSLWWTNTTRFARGATSIASAATSASVTWRST